MLELDLPHPTAMLKPNGQWILKSPSKFTTVPCWSIPSSRCLHSSTSTEAVTVAQAAGAAVGAAIVVAVVVAAVWLLATPVDLRHRLLPLLLSATTSNGANHPLLALTRPSHPDTNNMAYSRYVVLSTLDKNWKADTSITLAVCLITRL